MFLEDKYTLINKIYLLFLETNDIRLAKDLYNLIKEYNLLYNQKALELLDNTGKIT